MLARADRPIDCPRLVLADPSFSSPGRPDLTGGHPDLAVVIIGLEPAAVAESQQ